MSLSHHSTKTEAQGLNAGRVLESILLAGALGIIGWVGSQIGTLATSINGLREQVAVVQERSTSDRGRLDRVENRLEHLERAR